jgi:hypothetical protein
VYVTLSIFINFTKNNFILKTKNYALTMLASSFSVDTVRNYTYLLDYGAGIVYKTDLNWNYVSTLGGYISPHSSAISSNYLWVAGKYLYQVNLDNSAIVYSTASSSTYAFYGRIYYNPTTSNLFVLDYIDKQVLQYSQNLQTLVNTWNFPSFYGNPYSLNGYSNLMYIGTNSGYLFSMTITGTFTLLGSGCNGLNSPITSISFDYFGNMIQSCDSANSYFVYNGPTYTTYSNVKLYDPGLYYGAYDSNKNFVSLTVWGMFYIYN